MPARRPRRWSAPQAATCGIRRPFVGYVQLLYETNLSGGQRTSNALLRWWPRQFRITFEQTAEPHFGSGSLAERYVVLGGIEDEDFPADPGTVL